MIALDQDLPWGRWERRVFYVYPGTKLDIPISINVKEPFEIHISAGSSLSFWDEGHAFVCHMERESCLFHYGVAKKAHFILDGKAVLIHKNLIQNPSLESSEVQIDLNQEGARVDWGDGVNLQNEEHYQQNIKIEHFAPHTHSECCLKSIIRDKGSLNFVCDVFIREDATQSTAHQKNLNHVLSAYGRVTALPRLHIFNKNIEASHGTATQPIPEEILFYLQMRGLNRQRAEQLYLESFFRDFNTNISQGDGE